MKTCPICKEGAIEVRHVESVFQQDGRWVAISDIPALVCANCGDVSYPIASAKRIEDIVNGNEVAADYTWLPKYNFDPMQNVSLAADSTSLERVERFAPTLIEAAVVLEPARTQVEAAIQDKIEYAVA
jgi:YgiT-type zinc finger domain-containing protein